MTPEEPLAGATVTQVTCPACKKDVAVRCGDVTGMTLDLIVTTASATAGAKCPFHELITVDQAGGRVESQKSTQDRDDRIRLTALDRAIQIHKAGADPDAIVERAEKFRAFLDSDALPEQVRKGLMSIDEARARLTPGQVTELQDALNVLAGDPTWKHKITVLPENKRISFEELRALAAPGTPLRRAVDALKTSVAARRWEIAAPSGKLAGAALRTADYFERPDSVSDYIAWARGLVEDILVVDALTIYPNRPQEGLEPLQLLQLDGATIQPVLDGYGRLATYWQRPDASVERTSHPVPSLDVQTGVWVNFQPSELLYRPMWRSSWSVFGTPPIERVPEHLRFDEQAVADAMPPVEDILAHLKRVFDDIIHRFLRQPDLSWAWIESGDEAGNLTEVSG